jgi:hypothetical protein
MQLLPSALSLAGALTLGIWIGQAPGQESKPARPAAKAQEAAPAMPDMAAIQAAMTRAGTPGEGHEPLKAFEGNWKANVTMFMGPEAPPMVMEGAMNSAWILGGRFLEQRFTGTFDGQPFQGTSLFGYDNAAGRYVSLWIDNVSTHMSLSSGELSLDGKVFTMNGTKTDPMTGKPAQTIEQINVNGPDQHTLVAWDLHDGQRIKTMEIVYTRAR